MFKPYSKGVKKKRKEKLNQVGDEGEKFSLQLLKN
jgi:hypothetical protein